MSGDPEQGYFADGVVEDIITSLSRSGWLFVIARNSSFAYKGTSPDIRKVGQELGVRYVLEGSIRRAAGRVRIAAQLIDATTGGHAWAERFEDSDNDLFALQDRITEQVIGALEPGLRALQQFHLFTESSNHAARLLLHQAVTHHGWWRMQLCATGSNGTARKLSRVPLWRVRLLRIPLMTRPRCNSPRSRLRVSGMISMPPMRQSTERSC
jgi:TolB-like protein